MIGTVPAKGNLGTELATPPLCKSLNTNGLPRWPEGPPAQVVDYQALTNAPPSKFHANLPLASSVPTLTKGRENFFQEKRFAGLTDWAFGFIVFL